MICCPIAPVLLKLTAHAFRPGSAGARLPAIGKWQKYWAGALFDSGQVITLDRFPFLFSDAKAHRFEFALCLWIYSVPQRDTFYRAMTVS
ncbi:hypothetical protein DFH06DRAFT_1237531 [Mycena polygramma]|nr:hypothetical protein DFH06DRAFT_1237531 [Mycena polygramma]